MIATGRRSPNGAFYFPRLPAHLCSHGGMQRQPGIPWSRVRAACATHWSETLRLFFLTSVAGASAGAVPSPNTCYDRPGIASLRNSARPFACVATDMVTGQEVFLSSAAPRRSDFGGWRVDRSHRRRSSTVSGPPRDAGPLHPADGTWPHLQHCAPPAMGRRLRRTPTSPTQIYCRHYAGQWKSCRAIW